MSELKRVQDITQIRIALKIAQRDCLFVMLSEDGAMNRCGDGSETGGPTTIGVGVDKTGKFGRIRAALADSLLQHMGSYKTKSPVGKVCDLNVGLRFRDGSENGFQYTYGAESQGPHPAVRHLVETVVLETDDWYSAMLEDARREKERPR